MKKYEKMTNEELIQKFEDIIEDSSFGEWKGDRSVYVSSLYKEIEKLKEECKPKVCSINTADELEKEYDNFKKFCPAYHLEFPYANTFESSKCNQECRLYSSKEIRLIGCFKKWLKEDE